MDVSELKFVHIHVYLCMATTRKQVCYAFHVHFANVEEKKTYLPRLKCAKKAEDIFKRCLHR